MSNKQQWLVRVLIGGVLGAAAHVLLGYLMGSFSLFGPGHFTGFVFPDCRFSSWNYHLEWLGVLLSFALWALFGAEIAVATLPFADSGRQLVVRSLLHLLVTSATVGVWAGLNVVSHPTDYLTFLIPLFLVYFLIWLGRWVGWYAEVAAIRKKLGLDPGPSALRWRETLPYLPFLVLLCDLLPLLGRLCDPADVPVFSGLLLPYFLLPVAGLCAGISLGKRQGFCPLYPVLAFFLYLPIVFLLLNASAMFHCFIVAGAALVGNGLGTLLRRRRGKR